MATIASLSPQAWWRADSITGVADGQPVTTWADSSGHGFTATSLVGAAFRAGASPTGLPVLYFQGANSRYATTAPAGAATQTVVAVIKPTSTSGARSIVGALSNARGLQFRVETSTNRLTLIRQGQTLIGTSAGSAPAGAWSIVAVTVDTAASWAFRINGAASGSGVPTTGFVDSARSISAGNNNLENFDGDMAEIICWERVLTASELADVEAELTDRWLSSTPPPGTSVTVTPPAAAGTGTLRAPTVTATSGSADVTVDAPVLNAVGTMPEPTITSGSVTTVAAPVLDGSGTVPSPTVAASSSSTDITIDAPSLAGTGRLPKLTPVTAGTELLAGGVAFGGTLTSDTIDLAPQHLAGGFTFGSRLASTTAAPQHGLAGGFKIGGRVRQALPWGTDPRAGRPAVRVDITTADGTPITSLTAAQVAPVKDGVNIPDEWGITVLRDSDQGKKIAPVECHAAIWRGNVLMSRGPLGPGRADASSITYPVFDPSWLLRGGRRRIGRVPKRQLLKNADFTHGLAYWSGGYDKDSALKAPPTAKVVEDSQAMSGFALELGAVDKVVTTKEDVATSAVFVPNKASYLPGGEDKIKAVGNKIPEGSVVRIVGFTANDGTGNGLALSLARAQAAKATLAAMGKKFVFKLPEKLRSPNLNDGTVAGRGYYEQIPGGLKPNRRVNIAYEGTQTATGHQQYERQFLTVTQPVEEKVPLTLTLAGEMKILRWDGAPKDGWALRMILHPLNNLAEDKIIDEGTVGMDEATPRVRWADYQTSVEVPADGKPYTLEVRFYPPAGAARWVNVGLWPQDQLGFFDVDQALIVKALTEHVQDPGMGKGNLGIRTRTQLTGILRTNEYPFHERMPWDTAVEWFTAINRGLDIDCEVTETTATIVTHYPRQGTATDLDLVHGGSKSNVVSYRPLSTSTSDLASSIIMQADGSGAARPEAYARDAKALGGTLLEAVISAEDETPLSELDEGAASALAASIHPRSGWEVTIDPDHTTAVLDAYRKGDTGRLVLPDEGVDGPHRMVLRSWDPATDVLTLTMIPEEA